MFHLKPNELRKLAAVAAAAAAYAMVYSMLHMYRKKNNRSCVTAPLGPREPGDPEGHELFRPHGFPPGSRSLSHTMQVNNPTYRRHTQHTRHTRTKTQKGKTNTISFGVGISFFYFIVLTTRHEQTFINPT